MLGSPHPPGHCLSPAMRSLYCTPYTLNGFLKALSVCYAGPHSRNQTAAQAPFPPRQVQRGGDQNQFLKKNQSHKFNVNARDGHEPEFGGSCQFVHSLPHLPTQQPKCALLLLLFSRSARLRQEHRFACSASFSEWAIGQRGGTRKPMLLPGIG